MRYLKWIALAFAVMLGLVVAFLLVLGHLPDADRFQVATEIAAPPGKVWAFLDNEQNMTKWVSWLTDVKRSGPGGQGSLLTLTMRDENNGGVPVRIESRCTEYVPPSLRTEAMATPGQFEGTETYRLTGLANGKTRLDVISRFHFTQWFANLMSPLVLPAARSKMQGDLERFKTLVEGS
jgi:uncharacterized protein YndB with AHSA1/START domain